MVPAVAGETNYAEGVLYQYKAKLGLGSHTYSFAAKSGSRIAVGDTVSHSGPIVSTTVPQEWRGATDQGKPVSFTVSGDGTSMLDFTFGVRGERTIVVLLDIKQHWEGDVLVTEYVYGDKTYYGTVSGTIPRMDILNKSFRGTYSAESDRANLSGTFTSPITAEGNVSGSTEVSSGYGGTVSVSGSATWSASIPSSVVIHGPKDGVLLNSSSVKVSGVAEGALVHSVEINGTPVQLTEGAFSANVSLAEGPNTIHLIAFDADQNIVGTYTVRVILDSTPPVVTLTEPTDSLETSDPRVTIKGTVDDPSILYVNVNDVPICVAEGQFSANVFLRTGVNTILVNASDEVGNLVSTQIAVVRREVTAVDELSGPLVLPEVFALQQNYPNPFNASTTVRYQLPKATEVQLSIYNLLGQKVRTVVDGVQPAGFYAVIWDGRNQSGVDMASGIYLYRLTGGDRSLVKKMLILR